MSQPDSPRSDGTPIVVGDEDLVLNRISVFDSSETENDPWSDDLLDLVPLDPPTSTELVVPEPESRRITGDYTRGAILSQNPIRRRRQRLALLQDGITRDKRLIHDLLQSRKLIFGVANDKGGAGKTHTVMALSEIIAWLSNRLTVVFDANTNHGQVARWMGFDPSKTFQLHQVFENREIFNTYATSIGNLPAGPYGVRMIAADDVNTDIPDDDEDEFGGLEIISSDMLTMLDEMSGLATHSLQDFVEVLGLVRDNSDVVVIDTSNKAEDRPNLASVLMSTGMVFVTHNGVRGANDGCKDTIRRYMNVFSHYKMAHKIRDRSVILVIGGQQSEVPHYAHFFDDFKGPIIPVPIDPEMERKSGILDVKQLRDETLYAYMEVVLALLAFTTKVPILPVQLKGEPT